MLRFIVNVEKEMDKDVTYKFGREVVCTIYLGDDETFVSSAQIQRLNEWKQSGRACRHDKFPI